MKYKSDLLGPLTFIFSMYIPPFLSQRPSQGSLPYKPEELPHFLKILCNLYFDIPCVCSGTAVSIDTNPIQVLMMIHSCSDSIKCDTFWEKKHILAPFWSVEFLFRIRLMQKIQSIHTSPYYCIIHWFPSLYPSLPVSQTSCLGSLTRVKRFLAKWPETRSVFRRGCKARSWCHSRSPLPSGQPVTSKS